MTSLKETQAKESFTGDKSGNSTIAKCYFNNELAPCGDVKFCSLCGEWLCEGHRKNYPRRMMAFLKEKMSN